MARDGLQPACSADRSTWLARRMVRFRRDKLCQTGGKVLLLGSRHDEVTLLHYAEHIAEFDDKRVARYKVPVEREGRRIWLDCEEFDTSGRGVHPNWPANFFELIVDAFITAYNGSEVCCQSQVGNASSVLMDAAALVRHAVALMQARARALGRR